MNYKTIISFAILIAALSIGYYFVLYLPQKERRHIELQEQEQLTRDRERLDRKKALNSCLVEADKTYADQWYRECKSQGKLTDGCISLNEMGLGEYAKQIKDIQEFKDVEEISDVIKDYEKEKYECSCKLPPVTADSVNNALQNNQDGCFRKHPQE